MAWNRAPACRQAGMCEAQGLRAPTADLPAGRRVIGIHPTKWGMGGGTEATSELQRLPACRQAGVIRHRERNPEDYRWIKVQG